MARIKQFIDRKQTLILSNQGLFVKKAQVMPSCAFVIGYDTYVRILNPRYYSDSPENLSAALAQIKAANCSFIVGGRLVEGEFKDAEPSLVPAGHEDMFSYLSEAEFRVDLSSTELRNQGKGLQAT